jgi:hypothetical protein
VIDAELLLYTLLNAGKPPGSTVQPETDLDSIDHMPLVLFDVNGDGQTGNGPGLWFVTLNLSVIDNNLDAVKAVAGALYDLVWSWNDPANAVVEDVGWVSSVEDLSYFSRSPIADVNVRGTYQYDGAFALQLRN